MLGFTGTSAADADRLIQTYQPGSIVLVQNTQTPAQTQALTSGLQRLAAASGARLPLLIAIDHEGGHVQRLTKGVTSFPPFEVVGATYDPAMARLEGEVQGRELRALGITMNLGPVLDVDTNTSNPIIGAYQRSIGADANEVAGLGQAYIQGLQSQGVMGVAKHFPGHGATTADSHLTLPRLPTTQPDLSKVDLVPFKQVAPEVGGVMTGHILFPNIDPVWPSSLSPIFVKQLLRNEIGFQGLVVTDDLAGMAAIVGSYDAGTSAVQALSAGNDVVLIAGNPERQAQAVAAVREAVNTGKLPLAQVDASVRRVLEAKERYGLLDGAPSPEALPRPDQGAVQQLADAAMTLVRDPLHQVPLPAAARGGLVINTGVLPTSGGETRLTSQLQLRRPGTRELSSVDQAVEAARQADFVVVATLDGGASQKALLKDLRTAGIHPIVVDFGNPSDITGLPSDAAYLVAYAPQTEMVDAAVKVLLGEISAAGRLPVALGKYAVGSSALHPAGSQFAAAPVAPSARSSRGTGA
jgi:beta-N-acetylhexosaminidase